MERLLRFQFVIVAVLGFGFAMSNTRAESPGPNVATFDVDGLTLSMPIDDFRQLYPEIEITEKTAARYCYGKEVRIDPLTRLGAVVRRGGATVHITFDHKYFGQRISTIKRDEVIEFSPSLFTSLRDGLVRRYGPYTGIKYPDKIEPACRSSASTSSPGRAPSSNLYAPARSLTTTFWDLMTRFS